ncbi:hypothetical protein DSO57_1017553 [Entomophthora muscae]|uniref:Uncharacterized protein n=1 Tax=Entomophthora muscae TaxID=34485 RepID=A0ACC2STN7_9FUNG|nr:hypothetical protein DSO57_1017553 [Entomophthora muscae]
MYTKANDSLNLLPAKPEAKRYVVDFRTYIKPKGTTPFEKKRTRRKPHEIQRHYKCTFQGCQKSYGTLNHLNDHILLQSHGPKHTPDMYHELRSNLRKKSPSRPLKLCLHHLIHHSD